MSGRHRLLELDPDLGRRLATERMRGADHDLTVGVLELEPGAWSPRQQLAPAWGAIALEGALLRDVVLVGAACSELIGPGDVFAPLDLDLEERLVPSDVAWNVLEPTRVVVLDAAFAARAGAWPEVVSEIFERAAARSFRLSVQMAICQLPRVEMRLLLMLWHLAERWGRVAVDEVVLHLKLSHRLLGQLVGARRPTVTLALSRLAEGGLVHRHDDGTWVLHGHQPSELSSLQRAARTARPAPARTRPAPGTALRASEREQVRSQLTARLAALRDMFESQSEATSSLQQRATVARERSAALRARLRDGNT